MRYVSFFSGIEMASLAFKPLGWEPVAFAEVDPFACAVLAHHYPDVPNLGDISKITDEQIESLGQIDLIIGGFPCQDVSNAGKRKGLRNDDGTATRSGLFFDAMRHVRAAHRKCGLRWLILENVPGLYSNNAGRDFATVVGEVVGGTFDVPREGWQDTGTAAGPRGMVEWCRLDAQWRGLAQRRERVFFVGDFGDWSNRPPILLERESLSGNPPACVAARQRPASGASGSARGQSIWSQIADAFRGGGPPRPPRIAGSLAASDGRNGADDNDAQAGRLIPETTGTIGGLSPGGGWRIGADEAAAGQLIPSVVGTLPAAGGTEKKHGHGWGQQEWENGFCIPVEVFAMRSDAPRDGRAKTPSADAEGNVRLRDPGFNWCENYAPTLDASQPHIVAYGGNDTSGPREVSTCLNAKGGGASRMDFESETFIAHIQPGDGFDASEDGTGRGIPLVSVDMGGEPIPLRASGASGANGAGIGRPGDPMLTLDTHGDAAIAFSCKDDGRDATQDLAPTMRSMNFDKSHANAGGQLAIAFHARQDPDSNSQVTHPLDTDGTSIGIAFDTTQITSGENRNNPQPGDPCHPLSASAHPPAYATRYEVRRLTPTECEKLMGVPVGYTLIPYRGKPAADGPRYKALGNGFAVPVIRWVGERVGSAHKHPVAHDAT